MFYGDSGAVYTKVFTTRSEKYSVSETKQRSTISIMPVTGYIKTSSRVHHLKFPVVLTAVEVQVLQFGFDDIHRATCMSGLPLSPVKHRGTTMPNRCADPAVLLFSFRRYSLGVQKHCT